MQPGLISQLQQKKINYNETQVPQQTKTATADSKAKQ